MASRSRLPLLVTIVVACAALVVLWLTGRSAATGEGAEVRPNVALAPSASKSDETAALDEDGAPLQTVRELGRGAAEVLRPSEIELDRALWIEGHVRFPVGSPIDETLAVIAIPLGADAEPAGTAGASVPRNPGWWGRAVEDAQGWTRTAVAADGSFRAPVPEGTRDRKSVV